MNHTKQQKGFTIIEVVLVLAIAALIFLMIFIALPALQRSQRDQARKSDAGVVVSAISNYTSTTRDNLTASDDAELREYIDKLDQYDKSSVVVNDGLSGDEESRLEQVQVVVGHKCDGNEPTTENATSRSAAVVVVLENNGSNLQDYCQEA